MTPPPRPSWARADHRCSTCKGRRFEAHSDMYFDHETQMWTRSCAVCLAKRRSKRGWDRRMTSKKPSAAMEAGPRRGYGAVANDPRRRESLVSGGPPALPTAGGAGTLVADTGSDGYKRGQARRVRRAREPGSEQRSQSAGGTLLVDATGAQSDDTGSPPPRAKRQRTFPGARDRAVPAVAAAAPSHGRCAGKLRLAPSTMEKRHGTERAHDGGYRCEGPHMHHKTPWMGWSGAGAGHPPPPPAPGPWAPGAMGHAPDSPYYPFGTGGCAVPFPFYPWPGCAKPYPPDPWCRTLAPGHHLLQPATPMSTPCPAAYPYWRPHAAHTPPTPHPHWPGAWPALTPAPPTPAPDATQRASASLSPLQCGVGVGAADYAAASWRAGREAGMRQAPWRHASAPPADPRRGASLDSFSPSPPPPPALERWLPAPASARGDPGAGRQRGAADDVPFAPPPPRSDGKVPEPCMPAPPPALAALATAAAAVNSRATKVPAQ